MLSKSKCVAFKGLQVIDVDVEVSVTRGIPSFEIVGLPNKSIEESKYRIKSAFQNCNYEFADSRITVNLAPADILKVGSIYDLAIAVGIFCSKNHINLDPNLYFFGELSLDGYIKNTRGMYLALEHVYVNKGISIVSKSIANFSADFPASHNYFVSNLKEVFDCVSKKKDINRYINNVKIEYKLNSQPQFDSLITEVIGNDAGKRSLEIAAAGMHNVLLIGSPGTGKSMLSKSIMSILPSLTEQEQVEIKKIKSYSGQMLDSYESRPFRAPHHTISYSGMIGGGSEPMPGEVTLAHNGVLFMDEFCEFSRNVLEALRQPLQDGYTQLTRHNMSYLFPSRFCLIAASNPCPCGYLGHKTKSCNCSEQKISTYAKKLSGPLADRIDLFVSIYPEESFISSVSDIKNTEKIKSAYLEIKSRVERAKIAQFKRYNKYNAIASNYDIYTSLQIDNKSKNLLQKAYDSHCLSPRAYFKILKVARTIADLEQSWEVKFEHFAEALQFRQK